MAYRKAARASIVAATAIGAALLTVPGSGGRALAAGPAPRLLGCSETSKVRPAAFNPICNDGNDSVIDLHWSAWSGSAHGKGEFYTHGV